MKAINEFYVCRSGKAGISWKSFLPVLLGLFLFFSPPSGAQPDPFTNITNDIVPQYNPAIDGDYIVYEELQPDVDRYICLYNIITRETKFISSNPGASPCYPDISGNRVVWQEYHNGQWDIYMYDISRPDLGAFPLIDFPGDQDQPAIDGDVMVYVDHFGSDYSANVFMYDFSNHELTQITDDSEYQQSGPDISGHYIVYASRINGGDIYLYNTYTKEKMQLTDDPGKQWNPTISGNRVVWQDDRDGNWNLYMHYILFMPGTPFENYDWKIYTGDGGRMSDGDEINPHLSGDYLVFQDNRNGNWDIYLYSFYNGLTGRTTPLVTEDRGQINPAISGDRVVWQDERGDTLSHYEADIWLWERPPGADLSVSVFAGADTVLTGDHLTYEIFVRNFGPENATNVVLTDEVSDKMEIIGASSKKGGGCSWTGHTITCNTGDLAKGETDTVTVVVKAVTEGPAGNSASVTGTETDPVQENNQSTVSTTINWGYEHVSGSGTDPVIAADAAGHAHICYLSDDYDLIYTTNRNGAWLTDTLTSSGEAGEHAIAVDKNGHVHIIYGEGGYDGNKLMYVNDTSGTWSTAGVMVDDAGQCVSPNIKVDREDYIHISFLKSRFMGPLMYFTTRNPMGLVWDCYSSGAMDVDSAGFASVSYYLVNVGIVYRTNSPTGQWTSWENVDMNWNGGQLESLTTDIALDSKGDPHVTYVGSHGGSGNEDNWYAWKSGGTWQNVFIDNGSFAGSQSAIAMDRNDRPHIIYYHSPSDEIRYISSASGSWDKHIIATDVGGSPYSLVCDIAADTAGYVYMAYVKKGKVHYMSNRMPPSPPPEPDIYVKPKYIDFQARHVGLPTDPEKVIIKNYGDTTLLIDSITVIWPDSVNFRITNTICGSLEPMDTCSVDIVFDPVEAGDIRAQLMIISNDPDHPKEFVELKGEGMAPHIFDYGTTDFGNVELRDSSVSDYVIKNLGNESLSVYEVKIEEGNTEDFYLTGLPAMPFSVDGGDSIVFRLVFKPTSLGEKTTKLRIWTNDHNPERTLTGTGVKPMHDISGALYTPDGDPVTEGRIFVYQPQEGSHETYLWHYPLWGNYEYLFTDIPEGTVTLRIDPDTTLYPGYLKTYLGNTTYWRDIVYFMLDHDTSGVDIVLVPKPLEKNGTCEVIGTLVAEQGSPGNTLVYGAYNGTGTPLQDISVFIRDSKGELTAYDNTNVNGEFAFHHVPVGRYEFIADTFGIFMSRQNDSLDISLENQKYYVTAVLVNDSVYTEFANVTGVSRTVAPGVISIFPNPVKDNLYLELSSMEEGNPLIRLFSADGTLIKEILPGNKKLISIPVSDLKKGIYILEVKNGTMSERVKVVKN